MQRVALRESKRLKSDMAKLRQELSKVIYGMHNLADDIGKSHVDLKFLMELEKHLCKYQSGGSSDESGEYFRNLKMDGWSDELIDLFKKYIEIDSKSCKLNVFQAKAKLEF